MATSPPDETWTAFAEDAYAAAAKPLVHQSFKTVNSNAGGGGIRIGADRALCLPYVCVRTLLARRALELDSFAGGAASLKKVKQLNWARQGHALCPPQERETLRRLFTEHTREGAEFNADRLDPRLRQVLIPAPDRPGGYVVLTPLTAAGVCKATLERAVQLNEDTADFNKKKPPEVPFKRRIRFAQLGLGGSNPQNIGLLVRSMQRPLFFPAPRLDQDIRAAMAIFNHGPRFSWPGKLLEDYRQTLAAWRDKAQGSTRLEEREKQRELSLQIARFVIDRLRVQSLRMKRTLPYAVHDNGSPAFSDAVNKRLQILAGSFTKDPSERRDAAALLGRRINEQEMSGGATLGLDQGGVDMLACWIEELL